MVYRLTVGHPTLKDIYLISEIAGSIPAVSTVSLPLWFDSNLANF